MEDVNKSGGTRLSTGKPNPVWLPKAGMKDMIRQVQGDDAHLKTALALLLDAMVPVRVDLIYGVIDVLTEGLMEDRLTSRLEVTKYMLEEASFQSMYGAKKYTPLDWHSGQDLSVLFGCAWRHLMRMWQADSFYEKDPESNTSHLGAVIWNLLCIIEFHDREDCNDIDREIGRTLNGNLTGVAPTQQLGDGIYSTRHGTPF